MRVDPKALKRAKDRLRAADLARWGVSMERRINEINRFTVGWTAYFGWPTPPLPFEDLDEWLRRRLTAGALEGMEAPPNAEAQPASARYLRAERPPMGELAQGVLAHRRLLAPHRRAAQRLLDRHSACKGFADPYRRFREC